MSPLLSIRTSFAWSLRAWISDPTKLSISSMPATEMSFPNTSLSPAPLQDLFTKLVESRLVFHRNRTIANHRSKRKYWPTKWFSKAPLIRCFPSDADSSNIPWNQPTTFDPNQIAEVARRFLLLLCALPALQYHVSLNDEALMYNDSRIDLHKLFQMPRNCQ